MTVAKVSIFSPIDKVWNLLLDVESFKLWSPAFRFEVEFPVQDASGVALIKTADHEWVRHAIEWKVVDGNAKCLSWSGGVVYLASWTHAITLTKTGEASCDLEWSIAHSGLLSWVGGNEAEEQQALKETVDAFRGYVESM
ncbi:hypothetical protein HDV03_004663 [Kappamyces sp. JEL0829]|nr:hypothetical protein HDV03_004663 [Kappamyces sp. JEL0829]